jgi:5-methylcytosine-specific restriction endonuclease McrA
MTAMRKPVLQLNASYEPLRIVTARRALTLITKGVAVVEIPSGAMVYPGIYVPSVIRLRNYRHIPIRIQVVSRRNIFMRDGYRCMYCGHRFAGSELTLDHVIPRSHGGGNSWENLVACCRKDNLRKADRTPAQAGMKLIRRPLPQNIHTPRFVLKAFGSEIEEWGRYLYSDSDGDQRYALRG